MEREGALRLATQMMCIRKIKRMSTSKKSGPSNI